LGDCYEAGDHEVTCADGTTKVMRIVLTDTSACGRTPSQEQPMCTTVRPNSEQNFNTVPSWMRITMRGGSFPHYAVIFVIDATAVPLWEDTGRCSDLARLQAALRRNMYTVVIAVTKLAQQREIALKNARYSMAPPTEVGKDPRSTYEGYFSRYIEKTCAAIQAKAGDSRWAMWHPPNNDPFPLNNVSIFDVPTYEGRHGFNTWQKKKVTRDLPNAKYIKQQLSRVLLAACKRSHPDP